MIMVINVINVQNIVKKSFFKVLEKFFNKQFKRKYSTYIIENIIPKNISHMQDKKHV